MRKVLFAFFLLLSTAGCFRYVPVEGGYGQVKKGSEVRARFAQDQSFDLSDITVHNIMGMDAEFVRADNSDVVMSAFWLDSSVREVGFPGDGWSVRVPVSNIASMDVKRVDWLKTTGVVLGFFVASYFGWEAMHGSPGDGDDPGNDGGVIR